MLAVYVGTKNDRNGNPRRGWIIYAADGQVDDFVEEGYQGIGALREKYARTPSTSFRKMEVTSSEYRQLLMLKTK